MCLVRIVWCIVVALMKRCLTRRSSCSRFLLKVLSVGFLSWYLRPYSLTHFSSSYLVAAAAAASKLSGVCRYYRERWMNRSIWNNSRSIGRGVCMGSSLIAFAAVIIIIIANYAHFIMFCAHNEAHYFKTNKLALLKNTWTVIFCPHLDCSI